MSQRGAGLFVASCIGVYFFALAGRGLAADFTYDDLLNLYFAWVRPLRDLLKANLVFFVPPTRPLGALFYATGFHFSGLNPLLFRLVCFGVLSANIWLTYCFARRLTGSREIAALTCLIHGFHGNFSSLYYNTGSCYDVFCFFFYLSAFVYYLRIRQPGYSPRPWQIAVLICLQIAALNSKEMAVTLPLMIGAYELLYHPGESWLLRSRTILATGAITLVYILGVTHGPESLTNLPNYKPVFSASSYMASTRYYLNDIVYSTKWFSSARALALLAALFAIAWLARDRRLKFCWFFVTAGVLPVAFIPPRGLNAVYIPMVGTAIFLAILIERGVGRITGVTARASLFAAAALALAAIHVWNGALDASWITSEEHHIRDVLTQMKQLRPEMPHGSRILFLQDPFPTRVWDSTFLLRLLYRDNEIEVVRGVDPHDTSRYDYLWTFNEGKLLQVGGAGTKKGDRMRSASTSLSLP